MTLRIVGPSKGNGEIENFAISQTRPDNWEERVVKLVPAEAMTLYGTGTILVQDGDTFSYPLAAVLIAACIFIAGTVRFRATKDPQTSRPQWTAMLIAITSFVLWVLSVTPELNPIPNDAYPSAEKTLPLVTLIWAAITPLIYKGSSS